ncbi:hypothetical protein MPTK1_6g15160 [Marchantia polymorpha subsp. ruderalis]|uniref:MBD domain-containing protein n=2 Tax=Marchantia polymorpha TaxID=3197 RepID=A0AAF6BS82_MARPO|nr:hypothetical protein MARPO_0056s0026 [Marchantia polymorpha]PTQ37548.1 hypothetical protein MARPO_0056s0026 [Marchantia polymorpha]BBN14865.1 hypothetical protein Mp_6g15160 [Marchantia polymorpha subsp. ruderalis]BBN14866.1 hypothetical protein Mp_6g15160 [Marchantia polymorpha subsp. ruderalis]|eukprot:PTQ37547.1 hypothetical protein MARPO_0056s0026 [Marchantia polymorpha]
MSRFRHRYPMSSRKVRTGNAKVMKRRSVRSHPLALRRGEGPPFVPAGWSWKFGRRALDYVYTSPSGLAFRSKKSLRVYLYSISQMENAPTMEDFSWDFSSAVCDKILGIVPSHPTESRSEFRISSRMIMTEDQIASSCSNDATSPMESSSNWKSCQRNTRQDQSLMKYRTVKYHPMWAGKVVEIGEDSPSDSE